MHYWLNFDVNRGLADEQLVALLERMPGPRLAGAGELAHTPLADVLAVEVRPVAAAQVAHLEDRRVDLQDAVVPRHLHELQCCRELNVAVVRAADDAASRLGELVLLALDRPAGEREDRSEEHTSELQSLRHLVCRLLLEKKNKQ